MSDVVRLGFGGLLKIKACMYVCMYVCVVHYSSELFVGSLEELIEDMVVALLAALVHLW